MEAPNKARGDRLSKVLMGLAAGLLLASSAALATVNHGDFLGSSVDFLQVSETALSADPDVPAKIKTAAAGNALAVWTGEHIVTIDGSRIDARPGR